MIDALTSATSRLASDYRSRSWQPTPEEQTLVEELQLHPFVDAGHLRNAIWTAGHVAVAQGRLAEVLTPAEALLEAPEIASSDAGTTALRQFRELMAALAADELGLAIEPSRRRVRVAGTTWYVALDGRSRVPATCGTCNARTGLQLTVDTNGARYACEAGHVTRDWRLTSDVLRQAIRDASGQQIRGDFHVEIVLPE